MRVQKTFNNEFDLTHGDLSKVLIRENRSKDNCIIWDVDNSDMSYNSFVLSKNTRSKTICEIVFYKSSITNKYIPRLTFKRLSLDDKEQDSKNPSKVIIQLNSSESAHQFWKLIAFLTSYKDLVDVGEFEKVYKVVPKESYILEFKNKSEKEKVVELKELINLSDLSSSDVKELTFQSRKNGLRAFFYLLKNLNTPSGKDSYTHYREKYEIRPGEEYIWHHFLKRNDWILGLNADLKFIMDFLDEQKVGMSDSKGRLDPQADFLGISDFTVLVELKHSNTPIFKRGKSKGRANTWDFTTDFIEGISQCLGQKFELDKSFDSKEFLKEDGTLLSKTEIQSIDPKAILLLGNKKKEFPVNSGDSVNRIKNKTLERFRRNNRNVDMLTYDELFERAYHIVYSRKLSSEWYWQDESELFK